jgi:perosamine synthetase
MHLALEALELRAGQGVLVPTMTFAATAEVVRYFDAVPLLVDCDPVTGLLDWDAAETALLRAQERGVAVVGIIPVHVGGLMLDPDRLGAFAAEHQLWTVEDAAHSFPAAAQRADGSWLRCGEGTADVSCYSFYANKTLTTGEGGMATTNRADLAERMRLMSLHGLSKDAWGRYAGGPWDYRIVAAGFKYNLTDIAAALGRRQLARCEAMRQSRQAIALRYREAFAGLTTLELPPAPADRIHSWHLFPVRLVLERLTIDRDTFVAMLRERGVGFSVHWRPLHLHPYYEESGWLPSDFPVATALFPRLVSLPLFPSMTHDEVETVVATVVALCAEHTR